jgi:hypothetical protein
MKRCQGPTVELESPLQHFRSFSRRKPIGLEGRRPGQLGLAGTEFTHCHGGQAITERGIGQKSVAPLVSRFIQGFHALDDGTAVGAGQGAQSADLFSLY